MIERRVGAAVLHAWAIFLVLSCGCDSRPAARLGSATAPSAAPASGSCDPVVSPVVVESERAPCSLRIVSAAPSATEICCALGLRDSLVGRSDYCTYPPDILGVPSIGALLDVNTERLLALKPDIILVAGNSRALRERLAPLNLRLESLPDVTLDDIYTSIRRVGGLARRPLTAEGLCARMRGDLQAVIDRYRNLEGTRALILTGTLHDPPQPPFVAGAGSFYDQLLALVGVTNAAPRQSNLAFAPLSLEYVLSEDPQVIIELDPDGRSRPGGDTDALAAWAKVGPLRAVRERRVRVLTGQVYYVPGPRVAQLLAGLCQALDPGGISR